MRRMLYDPARLERRFALFETLTLPSLVAQTSDAAEIIVLTGDSLPEPARARLDAALASLPNARVVALPVMDMFRGVKEALTETPPPPGTTHVATMRTDDDDAMHADSIARVHALAPLLCAADPENPAVIAFNKGFYLALGDGPPDTFRVSMRTPLGVGLTMIAPISFPGNIYSRNHRALPQFYNCYSEAERPMFLRSVHRDNDSSGHDPAESRLIPQKRAHRIWADGFGLDPDRVAALRC